MKISYKVDNGVRHLWHPHPAFARVQADDDDLLNQQSAQDEGGWLQESVNPEQVSQFWGGVVEDLRAKGELNDYHDEKAEEYQEDPAYK